MRRGIVGRFLVSLLVIHLFAPAPIAAADEAVPEWTAEIAQQLLMENWADFPQGGGTRVVGYALHFVELKREAWALLSLGLKFDTNERGPGLWLLQQENFAFNLLFDSEYHFKPSLQGEMGRSHGQGKYDSWLLTTEGEPLVVNISSRRLPAPVLGRKEERLLIKILPIHVQQRAGQVESEISLVYETLGGSAVEVRTTAEISVEPKRPIAVLSREVKTDARTEYQYFALYLAAASIPVDLLPVDRPFVAVGSIAGLELFMEETPVKRPIEFEIGANLHSGTQGAAANGSIPLGSSSKVYGSVQTVPQLFNVMGAEAGLGQDLYFVAELGGGEGVASLLVGVRDEVCLGKKTKISVTVLPIRFTLAAPLGSPEFNWRVRLDQALNYCGLWYQAENVREQKAVRHQAGLTVFERKPIAARLSFSWDGQTGNTVRAGLRFKF